LSPQLREALKAFRRHAMEWEDMWKAVNSGGAPINDDVRAQPFPKEVVEALNREIEDTKRHIRR
jgi:hypothetical protein